MDTKTLVKALKVAVREVIKEELTDILREGLQSTITEIKQTKRTTNLSGHRSQPSAPKRKTTTQFQENKWASILNQTDALIENGPSAMNSFVDMMNESYDTLAFNSNDAQGFGMIRQNSKPVSNVPAVMEDPETGKVYEIAPEVQQVLTRDYSALMKAINAKKGK